MLIIPSVHLNSALDAQFLKTEVPSDFGPSAPANSLAACAPAGAWWHRCGQNAVQSTNVFIMLPSKVPWRLSATRSCWDLSTMTCAHGRDPHTGRIRTCQKQESAKLCLWAKNKKKRVQIAVRSHRVCSTFLGGGGEKELFVPSLTSIAKFLLWPFSFQTMSHPSQPSPQAAPFKVLVERCRSEPLSQSTPMGLDQVGGRMQHLLRRRGE